MKRNKFSETQIPEAFKKQEAGVKVSDICREAGILSLPFTTQPGFQVPRINTNA